MAHREFIHASRDVVSLLTYLFDSGMQVMLDSPQPEPRPYIVPATEIPQIEKGAFFIYHKEWVFGAFQMYPVTGGCNDGKYFVQPRVNFSPISIQFSGERVDQGQRRFGAAAVSMHDDWLEMPGNHLHPRPPEVCEWFQQIVSQLSSRVVIRVGVHKYFVCREVLSDPLAVACLPPFDYIPWNSNLLGPHPKRGGKARGNYGVNP